MSLTTFYDRYHQVGLACLVTAVVALATGAVLGVAGSKTHRATLRAQSLASDTGKRQAQQHSRKLSKTLQAANERESRLAARIEAVETFQADIIPILRTAIRRAADEHVPDLQKILEDVDATIHGLEIARLEYDVRLTRIEQYLASPQDDPMPQFFGLPTIPEATP